MRKFPSRNTKKRKKSYQLLDARFDQLSERVVGVLHVQVVHQLGDDFRVGFALEDVAALLEESLDVLVVRDDSVVHHDEGVFVVRSLRM